MDNQYNYIYEKLVTSEDDVLGLIAYGMYKQHKIEFISKIKEDNNREPTQYEYNSFFAASTTESQLNNYRNQAEALLSETVANIANEELGHFEDEMVRNYKNEIKDCIPGNWKTFFVSVVAGGVSAFLFAIIAGVFYFIGETSGKSNKNLTKELMERVHIPHCDSVSAKTISY